ncbi:MAG: response regulator [Clostridia bacterium]|nr:response regulator [Clostridia bacterium]
MKFIAVDDEPVVLEVLLKAVREAGTGYEVQGFVRSRDALAAVQDGLRPDVAFLDIEMAGMTGLELAMKIREISHDTKIIFVTGYPQYALEAYSLHARGYLLKPPTPEKVQQELDELKCPPLPASGRIRIQTFGNFEVFAGERPLRFSLSKIKELLAYLVDRRGAAVNTGELCAVLWEQRPDSLSVRSHLRTLISDLSRTLSEAGARDILIKSRNSFAVDCEKLDCDLYGFLRQEPDAINTYMGEYMKQYTWAEMTLGELERQK